MDTPCAGATPGKATGQSVLQPEPQQLPQPPPSPAIMNVAAEMRAMNERMTCLQSSVDDVLWFLSQSRMESRKVNQGGDRDLKQTRPPPPKSASAWAVARSEALARSATILGSGMLSSARYNNFPTIPKQVAWCALHVNAESHALACACLFPRSHWQTDQAPKQCTNTHTNTHTHEGAARAWIHPMAPGACPRTDSHSARE